MRTEQALQVLLAALRAQNEKCVLVGLGSNVLFPDDGLEGLIVRLVGDFGEIRYDEGANVQVGAAVALPKLARQTARRGLRGLEALCGFPSTVGGAVVMNAGCYGVEIKDVLVGCRVLDGDGTPEDLSVNDLDPGYRSTNLQGSDRIVVSARFQLSEGDAEAALARIEEVNEKRWASLPMGQANVGSIFKNPPGDHAGRLMDECGLKGLEAGGARISEKHANVIVNQGGASSSDVLELMGVAYKAVESRFGVQLEPEIILAGKLWQAWDESRDRLSTNRSHVKN